MANTTTPDGLPAEFLQRLEQLLPAGHLEAWHEAFRAPPPAIFRANTLLATEEGLIEELCAAGLVPERLGWPAEAWSVPADQRRTLTDTDAARDGRAYVQNPSSMVPVAVLAPQPGEEVLDLAAAPGGKTVQLAGVMGNVGRIAAVESVKGRFHHLRRNLERCGVQIAQLYLADGRGVGRKVPERFDRVLLDAPCTSEGRFRAADADSYRYWSPKKIRDMVRKQKRLAISAVQALKPGGVLVYCTCTLAPEENEGIVDDLLRRFDDVLDVEPIEVPEAFRLPAVPTWAGKEFAAAVAGCARLAPGVEREGFFVARLRKTASVPEVVR